MNKMILVFLLSNLIVSGWSQAKDSDDSRWKMEIDAGIATTNIQKNSFNPIICIEGCQLQDQNFDVKPSINLLVIREIGNVHQIAMGIHYLESSLQNTYSDFFSQATFTVDFKFKFLGLRSEYRYSYFEHRRLSANFGAGLIVESVLGKDRSTLKEIGVSGIINHQILYSIKDTSKLFLTIGIKKSIHDYGRESEFSPWGLHGGIGIQIEL